MTQPNAGPFSAELVPFPTTDHLPGPTPVRVRELLREQFNAAVQRERDRRGAITGEQTVWPMVRSVQDYRELMEDYGRAFTGAAKDAQKVLEEELFEAVPEQDGIPMGNLNVPAGGSTISVKAKTANKHTVDPNQVVAALAALVEDEWRAARDAGEPGAISPDVDPLQFAVAVALRALEMVGSVEIKVTHARALAVQLGHLGEDQLSAVVSDAIRTTKLYKGITVERKAS